MSRLTIHAMPGQETPAHALAARLQVPIRSIAVHRFPDGESLVTVAATETTAVVFCSLDRPNEKLVELMLAAAALGDRGAGRLILVAPYMCYMRQDTAFQPGQAVSQIVVGRFLAGLFDRIVTVDPHLHRRKDMAEIFPGAEATALSSAPLIADYLKAEDTTPKPVLVGPDAESEQWVLAVARPLGCEVLTARKTRLGDGAVDIAIPEIAGIAGRPAILIDDVVSTGITLARCAGLLRSAGATGIDAIAVHGLADDAALATMRQAGIGRLVTTDSVAHPTNAIALAPLLADALKREADG